MGAYTAAFPLHDGDVDSKIIPAPIRKVSESSSYTYYERNQVNQYLLFTKDTL